MPPTLAIIGSAGRQGDARHVSRGLYDYMFAETLRTIDSWGIGHAVSGGAAFADHLAVRAFLGGHVSGLTLFLPAAFGVKGFAANNRSRVDAGSVSNGYHREFSSKCGVDSLGEIAEAIRRGAKTFVHEGFQTRNIEVANAVDHMLAFTFGSATSRNVVPEMEGFQNAASAGLKITKGTAHCWGEAWKCQLKTHINVNEMVRSIQTEQTSKDQK